MLDLGLFYNLTIIIIIVVVVIVIIIIVNIIVILLGFEKVTSIKHMTLD